MPRDRRDLISGPYHAALARAPEERPAFLLEAAMAVAGIGAGATSMIDRRFGPYRRTVVVSPLGP